MEDEMFRIIPGYEHYAVDRVGTIVSVERKIMLTPYLLNGYLAVDTFRGSKTETLPVHRAVALAWVYNPDPDNFTVVNHIDAHPGNNWYENLEWTSYSGNNYHAVNSGLRRDNIPCRVRDYFTGEVSYFHSITQAAEFMGLGKDVRIVDLRPKMFGKLVAGKYEFRCANDPEPWFYENRTELVPPSRYMVTVKDSNGSIEEVYSTRELLKRHQLYGAPGKSIPVLAQYGNEIYPDKEFNVRDSYSETPYRYDRGLKGTSAIPLCASKGGKTMEFGSLTQCARHFNVDRSSILSRLDTDKNLDGWIFTTRLIN